MVKDNSIIKIYRGTQIIHETSINVGAKGVFLLKTSDYILLPFSLQEPVYFKIGDYADLTGVFDGAVSGLLATRYEVTELQMPTYNESTGGYDYVLKLDAYYWKWKNKIFKYIPEQTGSETSWALTASLDVHMDVFLRNLKALGYKYNGLDFQVSIDSTVENKAVSMTYENMNLLEALFAMSSENAWNCDVWVTDNIIHFGKNEYGTAVKIERNVEAGNITRKESKGVYGTRIYAFGSTRNITTNYRPLEEQLVINGIVQKRLMLPKDTPYIDAYEGMTEDEAIEKVVVFDDVYPRRVSKMSDVHTRTEQVKNDDGTRETVTYYRYKDAGFIFDEKYKIEGENLKIEFQSGKLNGKEFEVIFNPDPKDSIRGEQLWEIVRNENYGRYLPDDILKPENGDEFALSGFNIELLSNWYIPAAEKELKEKAQAYAQKIVKDDSVFQVTFNSSWVYESENTRLFEFGQRVNLIDPTFFKDGRQSRVLGWEVNLDIPWDSPVYTIGESMPYSRIGEIEDKIDALTYKGQTYGGSGGSGIYVIKTNDTTPARDSNVFSARRSRAEFLHKNRPDRARKKIIFDEGIEIGEYESGVDGALIDGSGNGELLTLIVRELLRSPEFKNGMTGEGWQLAIKNGLAKLELDELTVRRVMHVFELIIDKIRSVGGQIVVSAANGKIRSVTDAGDSYLIQFDGDNYFQPHDLMRCQTYTGTDIYGYWVEVGSAGADTVTVPKSEFAEWNSVPREGDEVVLMGNTENALRQSLISISAAEDGQPRIDILDGVRAKNFNSSLRARLGSLDGINSSLFPLDNQPHGNGLFADNAYLKGTFLLSTGEDIKTRFEITDGRIESSVSALRQDFAAERGYLSNPSFADGLSKWQAENETYFWLFGQKWIWGNGNVLARKGDGSSIIRDDSRVVLRIRNSHIVQLNSHFRSIPTMETNSDGEKEAMPVYLTFLYRCYKGGSLHICFDNVDKSGFADFESMDITETIEPTEGYVQYTCEGLWNGTGDFRLSFTGEICLYMLILSTDKVEGLVHRYRTLFEQSEKLVRIAGQNFDEDGHVLSESGIMVKANGSGIYAQGPDGELALIGVAVEETDADGNTKTVIKLTADNIKLEGLVTANGNFKIKEDGSIETTNGKFTGEVDARSGKIGGFDIANGRIGNSRNSAMSGNSGMTITGSYVRAGTAGNYGAIGSDLSGSMISGGALRYSGYISCTDSNYQGTDSVPHTSYGMGMNVQNSQTCVGIDMTIGNSSDLSIGIRYNVTGSNRSFAFCGKGTGVLRGLMEGYMMNVIVFNGSNPNVQAIDLKRGKYVLVGTDTNSGTLVLPSLTNVCEALDISHDSPGDIAVRLTIYCRWGSNISLVGRRHIDGGSWEYPLLRDNDNNDNWSTKMAAGDTIELLLTHCYAGHEDSYNAYILTHMH